MTDWQSRNGYYPLIKGKIATLVFYFEIYSPFPTFSKNLPAGLTISQIGRNEIGRYRDVFRAIGAPWLWISRLRSNDEELESILCHPKIEAYIVSDGKRDAAFLEIDFQQPESLELRYLGVLDGYFNRGIGSALMSFVFDRAAAKDVNQIWLHTCHFDSPSAGAFYQRFGFRAEKAAIEVMDDPRLTGDLPLQTAPHIPLLK